MNGEIAAPILFIVLYVLLGSWIIILMILRDVKVLSRFMLLFIYCIVRLAGQICGLIYMINLPLSFGLILAYFILTAEGYFIIVWAALSFLMDWHKRNWGSSFVDRPILNEYSSYSRGRKRLINRSPKHFFHILFIIANALLVASASIMLSSSTVSNRNDGKILRTVGSSIFLAGIVFTIWVLIHTFRLCYYKYHYPKKQLGTLILIAIGMPFLLTRGIFGVIQSCDYTFSYSNPANYTANGFSTTFLVGEYVLIITMEWITCAFLVSTRRTIRYEPHRNDAISNEKQLVTESEN